jgi:alkanesulfonate monooxygenase SsuD/methylene tetrahydromethanopterin reductase-like flavin-dependent oxidoreductase (luciferase family)
VDQERTMTLSPQLTTTIEPEAPHADPTRLRVGLSLPNFAEPDVLVDLGVRAEAAGWDGVFLWDHLHGSPAFPVPTADPWVVLGALATRTERITIGTGITPVPRRQPEKLARETVTVDHLSHGRLVLGVGLGEPPEEHTAYGRPADRPTLAAKLDEGLVVLTGLWRGEPFTHEGEHFTVREAQYLPVPVQTPRIPVWVSCTFPHQRSLARAARWDGAILAAIGAGGTIDPVPPRDVRAAVDTIAAHRLPEAGPLAVALVTAGLPTPDEQAAYADAGATWILATGWLDAIGDLVDAGPGTR